jgi:hypothetical protein
VCAQEGKKVNGLRRAAAALEARTRKMSDPKPPPRIDVNRPSSEAVPNDPDSDFDDPPKALPPKKRAKATTEGPRKHVSKPVPCIGGCGWKNLDRTILEVRDAKPGGFIVLCLLSESLELHTAVQNSDCDSKFVAHTRDGQPFRLHPDESDLSEDEFMGLFASGPYDRADPGVSDTIIAWLKADARYTVLVVDASERGLNFARLAASVATMKLALDTKARSLAQPKPADAKWKAALTRCARGRSWAEVREHARDWFVSL